MFLDGSERALAFGDGGVGGGGSSPGPPPPPPPPTTSPTASPESPTQSPVFTDKPTPLWDFDYRAEGDSSFGHRYQDTYSLSHQHAFRRMGWSWGDWQSGLGAFCFRSTCHNVASACNQFGGLLLHESVCSFPENIQVAGPSCWQNECNSEGTEVCNSVGGVTIGGADGSGEAQWCVFDGARTLIGPMCYGAKCFSDENEVGCAAAGGQVWNKDYCILEGYYTKIGPLCWNGDCIFGDASTKCRALGGTLIARRWCAVPGCDRTVIGPTCSMAVNNREAQCFEQETVQLCNELGGTQIANRFCVLPGTDWTFVGPTVYQQTETIGPTNDFCRQLEQTLGTGYFNFGESYEIAGRFCLVKDRIPTTTPFCDDESCKVGKGRAFCKRFGGKTLAKGFMCSLCDSFRQVVGPMVWNGTKLEGNSTYCINNFCAVPRFDTSTENKKCPTSDPVIPRCGQFGGAIGVPGFSNGITPDGDDDDDDDGGSGGGGDPTGNTTGSQQTSSTGRTGYFSGLVVSASLFLLSFAG